jgi:hypothetical protein
MLTSVYLPRTQQLLQNPGASNPLYSTANLEGWINQARLQLSGEARCIRYLATVNTQLNKRNYLFSALNTGVQATNGIQGVFNVRSIRYAVASGYQAVYSRAWEWFDFFYLNNPVPSSGAPVDWAQHFQGSAGTGTGSGASGSLWLDPLPDEVYVLTCDCDCYPQVLSQDTDVEAIPYPWTDAVAFLSAYYALLSSQTGDRQAQAERLFGYYKAYVDRARQFSNPDLSKGQWEQAPDPTLMNKLALGGGPSQ